MSVLSDATIQASFHRSQWAFCLVQQYKPHYIGAYERSVWCNSTSLLTWEPIRVLSDATVQVSLHRSLWASCLMQSTWFSLSGTSLDDILPPLVNHSHGDGSAGLQLIKLLAYLDCLISTDLETLHWSGNPALIWKLCSSTFGSPYKHT